MATIQRLIACTCIAGYPAIFGHINARIYTPRENRLFAAKSTENNAITAEARTEALAEVERAASELAAALDESRVARREQAQSIANEAASRVLGRSL